MEYELQFAEEARDDIAEAYDWYEDKRLGVGEEFLNCVEAGLDGIKRNPRMYAKVYRDFRRAIIRRFPYGIFFELNDLQVTVFAIFHSSRDPKKWRMRRT